MTARRLTSVQTGPKAAGGFCTRRPYPLRCATCPVMAWPTAGEGEKALLHFADTARCTWDDMTSEGVADGTH